MVGNGDVHRLMQLGTTWTMVDVAAGANADMICEAVAAGRVEVESRPLSVVDAARIVGALIVGIETATPVGDTDRRCATNSRLASSIAGLPISSGDISQS
jgi:hypothetical protein